MAIFFFVIGILLAIFGTMVITAHITEGMDKAMAELLEKPYRRNVLMSIPLFIGIIFIISGFIILVTSVSSLTA